MCFLCAFFLFFYLCSFLDSCRWFVLEFMVSFCLSDHLLGRSRDLSHPNGDAKRPQGQVQETLKAMRCSSGLLQVC